MEWIESDSGYDVCIESKRITVCNLTTRIINLDQIIAEKHNKVNILSSKLLQKVELMQG